MGEGNHPLSSRVTSGHILTLSGPRICSPSRSDSTGGRHDSLKLREVTIICGVLRVQVRQFLSPARPWGFRGSAQWGTQSLKELRVWKETFREPQEAGSPTYGLSYPGHSPSPDGLGHTPALGPEPTVLWSLQHRPSPSLSPTTGDSSVYRCFQSSTDFYVSKIMSVTLTRPPLHGFLQVILSTSP